MVFPARFAGVAVLAGRGVHVWLQGAWAAISTVPADRIRPIEVRDFTEAARRARPSVSRQQLGVFEQ